MSEVYSRSGNFATRTIGGEMILVPIRAGVADLESVFTFNDVGAAVWQAIESPRSTEEIVRAVAREFEVDDARARADVLEFLGTLKEAGLVQETEAKR